MVKVRPFAALRPPKELVEELSSRPYDVMNSEEAAAEAGPKSLLHITRPEIDFNPIADETEDRVFHRAADNFCTWQERGYLVRDPKPCYYIYAQTMGEHIQYGIVLCSHKDDYFSGSIKKHELTRKDKEDGRMKHILIQNANIEPVFFSYPQNDGLDALVARISSQAPEYDFVSAEGFGHKFWVVSDESDIAFITDAFAHIPAMYIADGHHRSAAAARVGQHKQERDRNYTGEEEYNYFMAVCFPDNQLKIMDYNRVVKDLNGLSARDFISELSKEFEVESMGAQPYRPSALHQFSMYLGGTWYRISPRRVLWDENDPIGSLDVAILSSLVLDRILGIKDLRTDKRIDFVGGLRGLGELQRRVDSGEMAVAFALYPVTMGQIISVADAGEIMPPKTTWFEPKLRSGLAIHTFFDGE